MERKKFRLQSRNQKSNKSQKDVDIEKKEEDLEDNDEEGIMSSKSHKEQLRKLMQNDPEFSKFIQEEDADLLNFEESDGEQETDNEEELQDEEQDEIRTGFPKAKKDGNGRLIFDGNHYDYLESFMDSEASQKPQLHDINFAVEAFQACIARVGADIELPKYVINEQSIFESVVRICFRSLGDVFKKLVMHHEEGAGHKKKNKKFKRFQGQIKTYLSGVLLFLNEIQSEAVIIATLRAIQQMINLYGSVTKLCRNLIKVVVRIWTRKTLKCRMVAYFCMNQLLKDHPEHLSYLYKSAYLGFVSNAREVTAETWPLLQFMHRTFAELTLVHPDSAYPYAFVYIRQTAIHLRNAIISKKRQDLVQTIYNWQLIQCLYLWVRVVSKAHSISGAESIGELSYPLTQIIIGVSQLHRAQRYLPLRFHCISLLIQLQVSCTTYIPVLSLASELLDDIEHILNTKPKPAASGAKTVDLECIIKVHSQARETQSFRLAACEHLFKLMLQSGHSMCGQPAFPDVCKPILQRITTFLKRSRVGDHGRLFRGLLEKLQEQSVFVINIMQQRDIALHDEMNVRAAKFALNNPDAPLRVFYRQWEKAWKLKQQISQSDGAKHIISKKQAEMKQETAEHKTQYTKVKSKKKKQISSPASKVANSTLPDTLADLEAWSD